MSTDRCGIALAGGGGPCQARAGHDGRGRNMEQQPWSHAYAPDMERERDHAEALAENEAHDLAMEKATEPTVEQLVQFATQRASTMPQTLRNRINSARTLLVVPPGRMQA